MILVDIYVPSVEQRYDFNLDEHAPITSLMEELTGMICQKEHCLLQGNKEELLLCRYEGSTILNKNMTLAECGVTNGTKLLLV